MLKVELQILISKFFKHRDRLANLSAFPGMLKLWYFNILHFKEKDKKALCVDGAW